MVQASVDVSRTNSNNVGGAIAHLHVYPPVQELLQKLHSKAAPENVPAQLDHTDGVNFIRLEIATKLRSAIPVMGDTGYPGIERARNINLGKDIYIYIYIMYV